MTRVLIAYGSRHGGTAEIAEWIAEAMREAGVEADVRAAGTVADLGAYDAVIAGAGLYTGRWQREGRRFVHRHARELTHLPVWLFSSGPLDRTAEEREIDATGWVAKAMRRTGARGHATFGGRLEPGAEGFIASAMAKEHGGDFRNRDQVRNWALDITRELQSIQI